MRYLVTGKQAAEIDRYTIEEIGVPQLVLMERASLAVAEEAQRVVRDKKHDRILVVAESGNNGGDGVAAARILHQRGFRVDVWALKGIRKASDAYQKQAELAEKAGVSFTDEPHLESYRIVIDAIFGVGLTREVEGIQKEAVDRINAAKEDNPEMTVMAVDIPSGISSETGEILGAAVKADRTVTFGYEKVGMGFAREYCGAVSVHEIGFFLPDHGLLYNTYDRQDVQRLLPKRSPEGNKGSFGRVLVVAGSKDMSGAAFLAAEAAYRTGCGLVKVITHESNRPALQQLLPEALLHTYREEEKTFEIMEDIRWASVVILGPGIGQSEQAWTLTETVLREATCPVIVDADAINLLSEHTELLTETAGQRPLILTPHMLEMTRLVERTVHPERSAMEGLKRDRIRIAEQTAEAYRATVVLKDACTLVTEGSRDRIDAADPPVHGRTWKERSMSAGTDGNEERTIHGTYLNSTGNDAMAKGGSGDVLTGVIAGLIAQGLTPEQAARLGVHIHGLAGDAARKSRGRYGVIARDLIESLSEVTDQDPRALQQHRT